LRLLTEGSTNREIASELGVPEDGVNRRLVDLYARIGVASRADATSAALLGRLV
jgi:DNA-binding NarL/FixJ family response regulator